MSPVVSGSSEISKFIHDHSYQGRAGATIREIIFKTRRSTSVSLRGVCILLCFSVTTQAIRLGQLSGVVIFKKIYGVNEYTEFTVMFPKEEVNLCPPLPPAA